MSTTIVAAPGADEPDPWQRVEWDGKVWSSDPVPISATSDMRGIVMTATIPGEDGVERGLRDVAQHPFTAPLRIATPADSVAKWDRRFLGLAMHVATWSKDPSTQAGAVIVDAKRRVVSVGYNGFPRGTDDGPELYADRERKYRRVVHAERNAMSFAQRPLDGCTLYVAPLPPCASCAGSIIQAGIVRVVALKPATDVAERWAAEHREMAAMFREAGVELVLLDGSDGI